MPFDILCIQDIIMNVCSHMNVKDAIHILATNKSLNAYDTNEVFQIIAISQFSSEFWTRASMRSQEPCSTIKKELLRIERFQQKIEELEGKRWSEVDFFTMWEQEALVAKTLQIKKLKTPETLSE